MFETHETSETHEYSCTPHVSSLEHKRLRYYRIPNYTAFPHFSNLQYLDKFKVKVLHDFVACRYRQFRHHRDHYYIRWMTPTYNG